MTKISCFTMTSFIPVIMILSMCMGTLGELRKTCCEFREVKNYYQGGKDGKPVNDMGDLKNVKTRKDCRDKCCQKGCRSINYDPATQVCHLSKTAANDVLRPGGTLKYRKGVYYEERLLCQFSTKVTGKHWPSHNDITDDKTKFPTHPAASDLTACQTLCCKWSCASLEFVPPSGGKTGQCRLSSEAAKKPATDLKVSTNKNEIYQQVVLQNVPNSGVLPTKCDGDRSDTSIFTNRCSFADRVEGFYQAGNNDISDKMIQNGMHPQVKSIEECQGMCCEHGCLSFDYNNATKECRLSSKRACKELVCTNKDSGGKLVMKSSETYQEKLPCFFQAEQKNKYQPARNDITDLFVGQHPKVNSIGACKNLCCSWSCKSLEYTPLKGGKGGYCRLSTIRAYGNGGGKLKSATDGTIYVEVVASQPHGKCSFAKDKRQSGQKYSPGDKQTDADNQIFGDNALHAHNQASCQSLCCNLGCLSYDFDTQSKTCTIHSQRQSDDNAPGKLTEATSSTYYERAKCDFEAEQKNKYLPARNDISDQFENHHAQVNDIEGCRTLCCEYGCKSLEYKPSNNQCRLSSASASKLGIKLSSSDDDIYQEVKDSTSMKCAFEYADDKQMPPDSFFDKASHKGVIIKKDVAKLSSCLNFCCDRGCLSVLHNSISKECKINTERFDGDLVAATTGVTFQQRPTCNYFGVHENKYWPGNNDITDVKTKFPTGHPKADSLEKCQQLCCANNCLSLEWTKSSQECRLSSKAAAYASLLKSKVGEYYQMRDPSSHPCRDADSCASKAPLSRCKWDKPLKGFLQQVPPNRHVNSSSNVPTLQACRNLCCQQRCVSINYDSARKICILSDVRACQAEDKGNKNIKCNGFPLVPATTASGIYEEKLQTHFGKSQSNKYMPGRNDISDAFLTGHLTKKNVQGCKDACDLYSCVSLEYKEKTKECRLSSLRTTSPKGAALKSEKGSTYIEITKSQSNGNNCKFENPMKGRFLKENNDISDAFAAHPIANTIEHCKQFCCEHGCLSFDWSSKSKECRLSSKMANANQSDLGKQDDEFYVERKRCAFKDEQQGKLLPGHNDLSDSFVNHHPVTRSIGECRALCCEIDGCNSLEFTKGTNECRLSSTSSDNPGTGFKLTSKKGEVYQEKMFSSSTAGNQNVNVSNTGTQGNTGLSGGAIAAIVIVVLVLVLGGAGVAIFFVCKSRARKEKYVVDGLGNSGGNKTGGKKKGYNDIRDEEDGVLDIDESDFDSNSDSDQGNKDNNDENGETQEYSL